MDEFKFNELVEEVNEFLDLKHIELTMLNMKVDIMQRASCFVQYDTAIEIRICNKYDPPLFDKSIIIRIAYKDDKVKYFVNYFSYDLNYGYTFTNIEEMKKYIGGVVVDMFWKKKEVIEKIEEYLDILEVENKILDRKIEIKRESKKKRFVINIYMENSKRKDFSRIIIKFGWKMRAYVISSIYFGFISDRWDSEYKYKEIGLLIDDLKKLMKYLEKEREL